MVRTTIREYAAFAAALDEQHPEASAAEMIAGIVAEGGTLSDRDVVMIAAECNKRRRRAAKAEGKVHDEPIEEVAFVDRVAVPGDLAAVRPSVRQPVDG